MLTQQEARSPLAGTSPRPLVICVDDAAQDAAVTEAVLQLAAAGRISATSAMVQAPGWPGQARSLAAENRIDLGLHLNFTQPLPGASAWPLSQVMRRAWLRGFARDWLEAQIDAQIEAFANHAGRLPDHIDGHQHVHQFPQIREALLARMAHWWRGAARRPWLRCTLPAPGAANAKAHFIAALGGRALRRQAAAAHWPQNACFGGVYGFEPDAAGYEKLMRQWLAAAPAGTVLMAHPATRLVDGDAIAAARVAEFSYLSGPAFGDLLSQLGVRPTRGSELF